MLFTQDQDFKSQKSNREETAVFPSLTAVYSLSHGGAHFLRVTVPQTKFQKRRNQNQLLMQFLLSRIQDQNNRSKLTRTSIKHSERKKAFDVEELRKISSLPVAKYRRKSCYCQECGELTSLQFSTMNLEPQVFVKQHFQSKPKNGFFIDTIVIPKRSAKRTARIRIEEHMTLQKHAASCNTGSKENPTTSDHPQMMESSISRLSPDFSPALFTSSPGMLNSTTSKKGFFFVKSRPSHNLSQRKPFQINHCSKSTLIDRIISQKGIQHNRHKTELPLIQSRYLYRSKDREKEKEKLHSKQIQRIFINPGLKLLQKK